ncbi:probable cyclic nucleotide-gated ion channel 14 [Phragmites australis]|uniref:probable cyclic nucleotide-gated ion channel 14 n=1 Tax=Phragmites australis TaxID=29695 RepID=UPI002D79BD23|nr:probable cyclic nucleotide-gated ion channel 14 [Phragmites australis]XP_062195713.1 probable cyclic nucleotide-gated ion channel 14 [Phragmites australis]
MRQLKDCFRKWTSQQKRILDPGGNIALTWNRIFLVSCVASYCVDPLFFFLLTVDGTNPCMRIDRHLAIVLTYLRTIVDMFFIVTIATRLCTAYVDPVSKVLGKGELVTDPKRIAHTYIRTNFFIDLVAALPVPQILVWAVLPSLSFKYIGAPLFLIILVQSAVRLYIIIQLSISIIKTVGYITKNGWDGTIYNLFLYLVASHVVGSIYYLLAVDRQKTCWETQCSVEDRIMNKTPCDFKFLDCRYSTSSESHNWAQSTNVFTKCNVDSNSISINYGIFSQAMKNGVATTSFLEKYFYSLWWGLQQLTTYGNPLVTSSFIGENLFAIGLTLLSIGLFAQLIGNMMTYMRSRSTNAEDWRIQKAETEDWMTDHQIPDDLRIRISRFLECKWIATQGIEEDSILKQLPVDLRQDIKQYLCLDLVQRVPLFSVMDQQLLNAICERMTYFLRTEGTYIIREGDPVKVMLFIIRGKLESSTTDGGRTGFFNSIILKPGDFCGEELLTWALLPRSSESYPSSTRTVRTIAEFEAFSLQADDIKFVASTFRMMHSKNLQHILRFYSNQWRTWAACFIQSAWRRHRNRQKIAEGGLSSRWKSFFSLIDNHANEARHQNNDGSSSSTPQGAEFPFSKIATIFLKAQKDRPMESDFSMDDHSE